MKFHADPQFIRWGLKFLFQCTEYKAKRNSLAKHRISSYSQKKLKEVVEETNIQYEQNANCLIYLYRNSQAMDASSSHVCLLQEIGQTLETVEKERALEIIPKLKDSKDQIAGGVFSPTDEFGDSKIFTEQLMEFCRGMGGTFESGVAIERLEASGTKIKRVVTDRGVFTAENYVLCLGAWSPLLVRSSLGVRISVCPVNGYSIIIPVEKGHTQPGLEGCMKRICLGFHQWEIISGLVLFQNLPDTT